MATHRQNTNLTTLGMFLEGFFVSPAVIPRLSVPPSRGKCMSNAEDGKDIIDDTYMQN